MRIEDRLRAADLPPLWRLAWLEIDLDALSDNLRLLRALAGPGVRLAPVVKADGYGHGLVAVARCLEATGADALCVSSLDEALVLRSAGLRCPIICLYPVPADAAAEAADAEVQISLFDAVDVRRTLEAWEGRAGQGDRAAGGARLAVHLAVETGFHRGGLAPSEVTSAAEHVRRVAGASLVGLWSHLASPDDAVAASRQSERFDEAARALVSAGLEVPPLHLAASGGLFAGTAPPHAMVRPGLALYGYLDPELPVAQRARQAAAALRPVMTLKARPVTVTAVPAGMSVGYGGRWRAERASRVAVLPVGYGDGFARLSQPGSEALVRGRRVPLVGTVSMDSVHADVTDLTDVGPEDEFVLFGAQGEERIGVDDLALRRTTNAWEVLAGMAARLARVYHSAAGTTGSRTLAGERHRTVPHAP